MLFLLRKIRRKLMEKNKFTTYPLYAVGEIILVVIVILIAVSLNNWNDSRKNSIIEAEYYCKLISDFELDRKNISKLYQESQYKIAISKKLLLELNDAKKDKAYFIDNYIQALRTNAYIPSKATITDILSAVKLNLL